MFGLNRYFFWKLSGMLVLFNNSTLHFSQTKIRMIYHNIKSILQYYLPYFHLGHTNNVKKTGAFHNIKNETKSTEVIVVLGAD